MKRGRIVLVLLVLLLVVAGVGVYAYTMLTARNDEFVPHNGARLIVNDAMEQNEVKKEPLPTDGTGSAGLGLAGEREIRRIEREVTIDGIKKG